MSAISIQKQIREQLRQMEQFKYIGPNIQQGIIDKHNFNRIKNRLK